MDSLSIEEDDTEPGFGRQGQSRNGVTAARLDLPRHAARSPGKTLESDEQGNHGKTPGM
jgi:hypothetical protein